VHNITPKSASDPANNFRTLDHPYTLNGLTDLQPSSDNWPQDPRVNSIYRFKTMQNNKGLNVSPWNIPQLIEVADSFFGAIPGILRYRVVLHSDKRCSIH